MTKWEVLTFPAGKHTQNEHISERNRTEGEFCNILKFSSIWENCCWYDTNHKSLAACLQLITEGNARLIQIIFICYGSSVGLYIQVEHTKLEAAPGKSNVARSTCLFICDRIKQQGWDTVFKGCTSGSERQESSQVSRWPFAWMSSEKSLSWRDQGINSGLHCLESWPSHVKQLYDSNELQGDVVKTWRSRTWLSEHTKMGVVCVEQTVWTSAPFTVI